VYDPQHFNPEVLETTQMWFGFWPSMAIVPDMHVQSTNARLKYHDNNSVGTRQQRLLHDDAQHNLLMQESVGIVRLRLVLLIRIVSSDCRFDVAGWGAAEGGGRWMMMTMRSAATDTKHCVVF
jgi:hypothetical protein